MATSTAPQAGLGATPSPLDFETLLREAELAHGHLCAGQILGVRMSLLACMELGVAEPRGRDRKRLVTFVEIDRCATDAIGVVTGCRLGKRALKLRDWGKMAATFVDLAQPLGAEAYRGIRVSALESSKERARELYPEIADKNRQQMLSYRELSDVDLFGTEWVSVVLPPGEFPGFKGERVRCLRCGEGINYNRFTMVDGRALCRPCAHPEELYYRPLA